MNSLEEATQQHTGPLEEVTILGRQLAELVDEWSVSTNGAKAQQIASEMIVKARQLLRASTPLGPRVKTVMVTRAGAGSVLP